jgi:hypothetical protein
VQIYAINGRAMASHPPVINVLPGEQVALRADVLQFGEACPHPEGCPEGRESSEFTWRADDRSANECSAAAPDACRDRTEFQPQGEEMIFHIPYAMGSDITLQVAHPGLSSVDRITLHNAHLADGQAITRAFPETPPGYYPDPRDEAPVYPSLASPEPYWGPYYPYAYNWWPDSPYPYYGYAGWAVGGPGWSVGVAIGPAWGWGWPYWGFHPWAWGWGWYHPGFSGWYAGYHPGVYGFYHPGWASGATVVSKGHLWAPAPRPGNPSPGFAFRPSYNGMYPRSNVRGPRGYRHGRH